VAKKTGNKKPQPATTAQSPAEQKAVHQNSFLVEFAKSGAISKAAKAAGINRCTHYEWMKTDPDYAAVFASTREEYTELLELEADRRAVQGTDRPVFYEGQVCGYIREFSDTLLIFRLKMLKPAYRENFKIEHTGADGGPIKTENKTKPEFDHEGFKKALDEFIDATAEKQLAKLYRQQQQQQPGPARPALSTD
jgi:hypothetical protein